MGYQENGIGFTDQAMASFNEASVPVSHSCPHHGHPQLRVVGMVYFPGKTLGNFSSGEIWVPKSVIDMICLPKSRLFTQVKSLLQPLPLKCALLRKGQGHITQGQSCTGTWVVKDGMWTGKVQHLAWRKPRCVILCQENTKLCHYFGTNMTQIWPYSSAGTNWTWHTWSSENAKITSFSFKVGRETGGSRNVHLTLCRCIPTSGNCQCLRWGNWNLSSTSNLKSWSCLDLAENLPSRAYLVFWIGT